MSKKAKLPSFIFESSIENLTIIWPNKKQEQKNPDWRDKWDNPGFDLDLPGIEKSKKGNWVMFGTWKRVEGKETYRCVRLFYKQVKWKGEEKIVTHYMQEQKKQAKLHFILSKEDRAFKNSQEKWVRKGSNFKK